MEWADGDPLRAQKLEADLNGIWFHRRLAWREQEVEIAKRDKKKRGK